MYRGNNGQNIFENDEDRRLLPSEFDQHWLKSNQPFRETQKTTCIPTAESSFEKIDKVMRNTKYRGLVPFTPGDTACVKSGIRQLTTKERSLVQTFPESYILEGTKTDLEQIIGNAVPVKLAEFVGTAINELISDKENNRYPLSTYMETEQLVLFEQKAVYKSSPITYARSK